MVLYIMFTLCFIVFCSYFLLERWLSTFLFEFVNHRDSSYCPTASASLLGFVFIFCTFLFSIFALTAWLGTPGFGERLVDLGKWKRVEGHWYPAVAGNWHLLLPLGDKLRCLNLDHAVVRGCCWDWFGYSGNNNKTSTRAVVVVVVVLQLPPPILPRNTSQVTLVFGTSGYCCNVVEI